MKHESRQRLLPPIEPKWCGGTHFIITVEGLGFGYVGFRAIAVGCSAVVRLVCRGCGDVRHDGRALGYLLAPLHRARQFLDTGTYRHLFLRGAGRHFVRLPDSFHHSASRFAITKIVGYVVGIPRAAGGFPGCMGRHRYADLRAIRRLVARRLRARRKDPESAAHGTGRRHDCRTIGCADSDSGADESGGRRGAGAI